MILGKKKTIIETQCVQYCEVCGAEIARHNDDARIWCLTEYDDPDDCLSVEICTSCFISAAVPALEAAGIKVRKRKFDIPDSYIEENELFPPKYKED